MKFSKNHMWNILNGGAKTPTRVIRFVCGEEIIYEIPVHHCFSTGKLKKYGIKAMEIFFENAKKEILTKEVV